MLCLACGYENSGPVRQCAQCGTWLSAPQLARQAASFPPGIPESRLSSATTLASFIPPRIANAPTTPAFVAPRASLHVTIGHCNTRDVDCSPGTITLGRAPDNTLIVDDGRVSRQHARIEHEGGHWRIRDVGSHNGTFVNGTRIHSHVLHNGDKIVVGSTLLEFHLH